MQWLKGIEMDAPATKNLVHYIGIALLMFGAASLIAAIAQVIK